MRYKELKGRALGFTCRRCINEKYGTKLEGKHCVYQAYPGPCNRCKDIRNIVVSVRPFSRWRVWFAKKKK